jgi:alpha-tubulin suppressor-like RCC1 family protein
VCAADETCSEGACGPAAIAPETLPVIEPGREFDRSDAGSAPCVETGEDETVCDGVDDNCNGATDEDVDYSVSPDHCGSCERTCTSGESSCILGVCTAVDGLASGGRHQCAHLGSYVTRCWGGNVFGQLGDGTTGETAAPTPYGGDTFYSYSVGAGDDHTCVVSDGVVYCAGRNDAGQIGDGTLSEPVATPVAITLDGTPWLVASGQAHTCAALQEGGVRCWGAAESGQLGHGATPPSEPLPVAVTDVPDAVSALACGARFTCVLRSDYTVWCWGDNAAGQLGNGTIDPSAVAVPVADLPGAWSISAGFAHACAVTSAGRVACWGDNAAGQLGDGTSMHRVRPVVISFPEYPWITAAGGAHTCALGYTGTVYCWGRNADGQLGTGDLDARAAPTEVVGLSDALLVSAGYDHTCAVRRIGDTDVVEVSCWGLNTNGQLGDGTRASRDSPVPVEGL